MVKIGFICEGDTEAIFLSSQYFKNLLISKNIELIDKPINVKGNGNLLPHNIENYTKILLEKGAEKIFILADLENDGCVTKTKERIKPNTDIHILIISKKMIESWLLSDFETLKKVLKITKKSKFIYNINTETLDNPKKEIKSLLKKYRPNLKGINEKMIIQLFLENNFSLERASQNIFLNKNNSLEYFIKKTETIKT
jgi:hypothetical protein